jgi:hypothetical protein
MDTLTIVADTLRTMMGATAADPYIRAIEQAVERAELADQRARAERLAQPVPTREPVLITEVELTDEEQVVKVSGLTSIRVPARGGDVTAIRIYGI